MEPKTEIMIPVRLVEALVDYAMRFAEQNEEPADGDCWATIAEAKTLADLPD
jgi:hypothetical protein